MKMVKSLLLGSAAGLVAVAGAQAADLPVKAKPVEYVKICSIYGVGFFYIPGTDTCIKIGGFVRVEYAFGPTGGSHSQFTVSPGGRDTRIDSTDSRLRARTVLSADTRTQTEYGTLRTYSRFGFTNSTGDDSTGVLFTDHALIQLAGFTWGKTQSYFDFVAGAFCYGCAYQLHGSQTGAASTLVFAYTAQLGGGLSLTLSVEDGSRRRVGVWDATSDATNALVIGAIPTLATNGAVAIGDYAAHQVPDIVGSLRVDQAWGSAQIMAALHQVRGGWYGNNTTGAGALAGTAFTAPADTFGWAVGAGVIVNLPWSAGDKAYIEGAYSEGALSYVLTGNTIGGYGSQFARFNGANVAAAWGFDSIFGGLAATGTVGHQLTRAWFIGGGIEHYWTPSLRTSIFANYTSIDYNGTATTLFCASPQSPIRTAAGAAPTGAAALAGCNPDFDMWGIGSRTIWNPAPMFDIGLEVMYTKVEQKHDATLTRFLFAGAGGRPGPALYTPSSEGVWSSILRLQRNFWP